ncbi:hypothetical protein Tco_0395604 [Tanacetum coccineum]
MEDAKPDEDIVPDDKISLDFMYEVLEEVDEDKLKKDVDEMLRQRCKSGDEHQYHLDQMKNYLKSDIVWESRKERFTLQTKMKKAPVVLTCQRCNTLKSEYAAEC